MRLLPLLLLAACPEADYTDLDTEPGHHEGDADTDSDAYTDADTDADTDTADTGEDTGGSTLPDARDGMARNGSACADIAGHTDIPAAQLWYWGELHGDEASGFSGEEAWYFYGNQPWYDRGLSDCEVHYDLVTVTVAGKGACAACEYGVAVEAGLNAERTTCPPSLYAGYETMEESYAIDQGGGGVASWYFPGSGNLLGTGFWDETGVNYLADDGCTLPVD